MDNPVMDESSTEISHLAFSVGISDKYDRLIFLISRGPSDLGLLRWQWAVEWWRTQGSWRMHKRQTQRLTLQEVANQNDTYKNRAWFTYLSVPAFECQICQDIYCGLCAMLGMFELMSQSKFLFPPPLQTMILDQLAQHLSPYSTPLYLTTAPTCFSPVLCTYYDPILMLFLVVTSGWIPLLISLVLHNAWRPVHNSSQPKNCGRPSFLWNIPRYCLGPAVPAQDA